MLRQLKFFSSGILLRSPSAFTLPIVTDVDDARELVSDGGMTRLGTAEPIRSARLLGFRFKNFDLAGKTCVASYLQFTAAVGSESGTNNTEIWCEASTNPSTFSGDAFDISGRTKSASSVSFAFAEWTNAGDKTSAQKTPDLTTIVNQAIAAGSLTSLVFIVGSSTGITGDRTVSMFDNATYDPPELYLEF